ncbi:Peroxiredoxin DOT5 [Hypsizygus marmoreus]|uniref:Peroxiredoxin DOT5 n=1 Tax=Hypsizygus marmoreus TaxID=39966 RepID=A0A369J7U4_HYPMA|nr:Peroxiredoxin DOT5 [Hypsizygus marmoreus]
MSLSPNLALPPNLPVPIDDGACTHLTGTALPPIALASTSSAAIDLSSLQGLTIVFCYPRTGAPGENVPEAWNMIPGARGCSPQACSFRDTSAELHSLGVKHIFGLSTQDTPYQAEAKERLHLPYDLLSDEKLEWVQALKLPTFEWEGRKLVKRLAIAIEDGKIIKTWYPIFPPDQSAHEVIAWLKGEGK